MAETVELLGRVRRRRLSIEDYDPATGPSSRSTSATSSGWRRPRRGPGHGMVLTARAENQLYGHGDLDDTIARLRAYGEAGADVVYAPAWSSSGTSSGSSPRSSGPVNVLALPRGPSVPDWPPSAVRRVSTGGALAFAAYGALVRAATELRDEGTSSYAARAIPSADVAAAFSA